MRALIIDHGNWFLRWLYLHCLAFCIGYLKHCPFSLPESSQKTEHRSNKLGALSTWWPKCQSRFYWNRRRIDESTSRSNFQTKDDWKIVITIITITNTRCFLHSILTLHLMITSLISLLSFTYCFTISLLSRIFLSYFFTSITSSLLFVVFFFFSQFVVFWNLSLRPFLGPLPFSLFLL